nr:hypothetical protein [Anoxybacillus flavithermus]
MRIVSIIALVVVYISCFVYASPFAATWDEVDFALALDRYDLLAMQPHFPGYPYFIFGGCLFIYLSTILLKRWPFGTVCS